MFSLYTLFLFSPSWPTNKKIYTINNNNTKPFQPIKIIFFFLAIQAMPFFTKPPRILIFLFFSKINLVFLKNGLASMATSKFSVDNSHFSPNNPKFLIPNQIQKFIKFSVFHKFSWLPWHKIKIITIYSFYNLSFQLRVIINFNKINDENIKYSPPFALFNE